MCAKINQVVRNPFSRSRSSRMGQNGTKRARTFPNIKSKIQSLGSNRGVLKKSLACTIEGSTTTWCQIPSRELRDDQVPRQTREELASSRKIQVAGLTRNLLIRNVEEEFPHFSAWKSGPSVPKRPFLGKIFCSLEREGWMTPWRGCRLPEAPRSRNNFVFLT